MCPFLFLFVLLTVCVFSCARAGRPLWKAFRPAKETAENGIAQGCPGACAGARDAHARTRICMCAFCRRTCCRRNCVIRAIVRALLHAVSEAPFGAGPHSHPHPHPHPPAFRDPGPLSLSRALVSSSARPPSPRFSPPPASACPALVCLSSCRVVFPGRLRGWRAPLVVSRGAVVCAAREREASTHALVARGVILALCRIARAERHGWRRRGLCPQLCSGAVSEAAGQSQSDPRCVRQGEKRPPRQAASRKG